MHAKVRRVGHPMDKLFYHLIEYVQVIHPGESVSHTYVSFNMLFIMFIYEAFRS